MTDAHAPSPAPPQPSLADAVCAEVEKLADETVIGPAFVSLDGVDMGLTTADGVKLKPEFENVEMMTVRGLARVRALIEAWEKESD